MEMLLVRQIAIDTIRIDKAHAELVEMPNIDYAADAEKWLFLAKKERREAINLLATLTRVTEKRDGVDRFGDLRDTLRKEEKLPKSDNTTRKPDGHDRRYYDPIDRIK